MTIEQSHGKARTVLPRSSDLAAVETVPTPTEGRSANGRFAPRNEIARGSRWKASIRRLIGKGATEVQADSVAREAFRLYCALLRDLPSAGPHVRMLSALNARHAALAAYETDRAAELGLDHPLGQAALERASKHGQRAERLAVTCIDVATKLAASAERNRGPDYKALEAEFGGTPDDEGAP